MIYLQRRVAGADGAQTIEIAVVENERFAAQYERQGFVPCSFEAFREAWRQRDLRSLDRLRMSIGGDGRGRGIYPAPS
ncbi:MAG TPA: hypothetical protein VF897_00130 [Roseiflexaceae bacterium]